jgi:hypothetical protein
MSCWDSTPDQCTGCPYCREARAAGPDQPVTYPDEQAAATAHLAELQARADHAAALHQSRATRSRERSIA